MALVDPDVRRALQSDIESATAKLVYLSLARDGAASVDDLEERLGEPRLRLYGIVESLEERGLVAERQRDGGPVYELTSS